MNQINTTLNSFIPDGDGSLIIKSSVGAFRGQGGFCGISTDGYQPLPCISNDEYGLANLQAKDLIALAMAQNGQKAARRRIRS
jgi:hypothetical protein